MLKEIIIPDFENAAGTSQKIHVFYRFYGCDPKNAPVVLVNHSLTGNDEVTGPGGWWNDLVGPSKIIDTEKFSILAINMPGNGTGGAKNLLHNYTDFTLRDIAIIYTQVLEKLKIESLFAAIGGSVGGALAWQLAVLKPNLIQNLIPVATHFKASPWVVAQCRIQDQILNNSADPVYDARMHAMTFYRTPRSLHLKFDGTSKKDKDRYGVESWLNHHGRSLENRFTLAAYKLMNHLLSSIDISGETGDCIAEAAKITGNIHLIGVDTDLFFVPEDIRETYNDLAILKENVTYSEITSVHGHDAFLIEFEQLQNILQPIFDLNTINNEEDKCHSVWQR